MADNTPPKPQSREGFEAYKKNFTKKLEEQKQKITNPNSSKPDATPDTGSSGGGTTPPGNGGNGNTGGGTPPDTGQNPPPYSPGVYDDTMSFQSNAYNLGKMAQEKKDPPAKHHSGGAKAPERKKDGYKPGESKDFLQACYNEIIVAAYAGAIDLGVNFTIDVFNWILFAPTSSSKSAEKKSNKNKEKTIFDYADEMITENTEKGKELIRSALMRHKEIIDNIECVQNGQTPKWRVWQGQEPQCFSNLLEVKNKADADPNSHEAALWKEFKEDFPSKIITLVARQTDTANFAVHHAALSMEMTDVEPLPVEITKTYKEMEKILENKELNDAEVKAGLAEKIRNIRQHTASDTPINAEINKSLNKFSEILQLPDCPRKAMAEKLLSLEEIHPIKLKLKEDAAAFGKEIIKNINSIDEAYAADPEQASAEKDKYFEKINESQKKAAAKKQKDLKSIWLMRNFGVKSFGNTKQNARVAVQYAENTIRHAHTPQNSQPTGGTQSQQPKKQIENDMDVINYINSLGIKR